MHDLSKDTKLLKITHSLWRRPYLYIFLVLTSFYGLLSLPQHQSKLARRPIMTSINSSLSNVLAIASQINELKKQGATIEQSDVEKLSLAIKQNFNEMLNSLMADDDDDKKSDDIFGNYFSNYQNPFNGQTTQNTGIGQSGGTGAQTSATDTILSAQNQLNLNNIF